MLSGVNIFVGDLYILKYFSRKKCIMEIANSVNLTKEYDKSFLLMQRLPFCFEQRAKQKNIITSK